MPNDLPFGMCSLLQVLSPIRIEGLIGSAAGSGRLRGFVVARRLGSLALCGALVATARDAVAGGDRRIVAAVHRGLILVEWLRRRDSLKRSRRNRDLLRTGRTCGQRCLF